MNFDKYQQLTRETAIYPGQGTITGILYTALGLGEAGEVQGKVKKILRDDDGVVRPEVRLAIEAELGDILWYVARLADELSLSLDGVAAQNLDKLASRKAREMLQGSGDYR